MPVLTIPAGTGPFAALASGSTYALLPGTARTSAGATLSDGDTPDISWQIAGLVTSTSTDSVVGAIRITGDNANLSIESGASISSTNVGVVMNGDDGFFQNAGTITVAPGAISAVAGVLFQGDNLLGINNGTISGPNHGFLAFGADDLTVINTGEILSLSGIGFRTSVNTTSFVHNSGLIRGASEGCFNESRSSSVQILINEGTITATDGPRAINGGNSINRFVNTGTPEGNVSLDGGADFLDTRGGTVTGIIFGENGTVNNKPTTIPIKVSVLKYSVALTTKATGTMKLSIRSLPGRSITGASTSPSITTATSFCASSSACFIGRVQGSTPSQQKVQERLQPKHKMRKGFQIDNNQTLHPQLHFRSH